MSDEAVSPNSMSFPFQVPSVSPSPSQSFHISSSNSYSFLLLFRLDPFFLPLNQILERYDTRLNNPSSLIHVFSARQIKSNLTDETRAAKQFKTVHGTIGHQRIGLLHNYRVYTT